MPIQSTQIKTLSEPLVALLEDGSEAARNEAATCLGILIKMVGERPMNAALDGLADVRKAKVKEASEKATVKCKLGAGGPPKATAMDSVAKKVPIKAKTAQATPTGVVYDDEVPSQPKPAAKPPAKLVRLF
jgi:cytoskeleton-associated protein 5